MSIKNISVNSYVEALEEVISTLSARKVNLRHQHIIIVPDRCTLSAERMICDRFGGAFDISVTTWSRLVSDMRKSAAYLPRQGSVMLIRRILEEKRKELKCYYRSYKTRGFASKLYDTINQLKVCGVKPDEVKLERGYEKSHDIAMVYAEYEARTEGCYIDAAGRMELLRQRLERDDFLKNATIYIACFDAFTKQMIQIISAMIKRAANVIIYNTEVTGNLSYNEIEVYSASSSVFAAKAIASRIAYEAKQGISYDDMCVVTASDKPNEIVRILEENGIPYCSPLTVKLSEHPLGRFLSLAISLPLRGFRAVDVVRLSKNPFSGIDKADSDALERYVAAYCINYKLFLEPFTPNPDWKETGDKWEIFKRAEKARSQICELLNAYTEYSAEQRVGALIDYAEQHCPDELSVTDAARANPFEKARALADLCINLLGGTSERVLLESMLEGMATTDLTSRPRLTGAVEVGGENDFRARRFKRVYVADFNSDTHPILTSDSGLLSDDDIEILRLKNLEIAPTTGEVNKRSKEEFSLLLAAAEKVMLIHTEKVGTFLEYIKPFALNIVENGTEKERSRLEQSDGVDEFLKQCPTINMAMEQYLSDRARVLSGFKAPAYYSYAKELIGDNADLRALSPLADTVSMAGDIMLSETTKVSQLECYFSCPLKHYFRYGLKLQIPDTGELQALDIGSILHEVAEGYIKVMDKEEPESAGKRLLKEAVEKTEKGKLEVNRPLIELLSKEAESMCRAIYIHIKTGKFMPLATEAEFGFKDNGWKGIELDVKDKRINLRGKIDRVDVSDNIARVMDYKTGSSDFNLNDLHAGLKLQLPMYLKVLTQMGYRAGGAFYYSTLNEFGEKNPYYLEGMCANDDDILDRMDENIRRGSSEIIGVKHRGNSVYVDVNETEEDINMLTDYAVKVSEQAVSEIMDGYIAPSPCGDKERNSCTYCEFAGICGYEGDQRKIKSATLAMPKTNKGEISDGLDA